MNELIAIAYPDEQRAGRILQILDEQRSSYVIDLNDAVAVTKGVDGKVKLHQSASLTVGGALLGLVSGVVVGLIFVAPPLGDVLGWAIGVVLGAVIGGALGAAIGAVIGHFTDRGISDQFVKDLGEQFKPGSSAIVVLVRDTEADRVLAELDKYGGTVLRTSLSLEAEAQLQAAPQQNLVGATHASPVPASPVGA